MLQAPLAVVSFIAGTAGGVYNVGFAVHDDNITARGHHVSFVKTLGLGTKADIQAIKLP